MMVHGKIFDFERTSINYIIKGNNRNSTFIMNDEYLIPADEAESKIVIKRSRFIAKAAFTPTIRAAKDFIRKVSDNEPGHSHAVYAYLIGYGNSVYGSGDARGL